MGTNLNQDKRKSNPVRLLLNLPVPWSSKKLVMSGPYRISRNPMYVSLTLAYLGEAGFLTQLWPVILLPLTLAYVNLIVIPLEEEVLKGDFKEIYEDYCARVHRWL